MSMIVSLLWRQLNLQLNLMRTKRVPCHFLVKRISSAEGLHAKYISKCFFYNFCRISEKLLNDLEIWQGFSGMNRFSDGSWSKVQCEMILAFLSFADYFRPKYFLLENVKKFVTYNKGRTFQLTMASLLEIGYQVIFPFCVTLD